jgi:hypothetical protein
LSFSKRFVEMRLRCKQFVAVDVALKGESGESAMCHNERERFACVVRKSRRCDEHARIAMVGENPMNRREKLVQERRSCSLHTRKIKHEICRFFCLVRYVIGEFSALLAGR